MVMPLSNVRSTDAIGSTQGWQTLAVPRRLEATFGEDRGPRNPVQQYAAADPLVCSAPALFAVGCFAAVPKRACADVCTL